MSNPDPEDERDDHRSPCNWMVHTQKAHTRPNNVGDVQDMARNALYILKDDETLQQFRNNALDQARRFDIENILPLYEKYYQHIRDNYNSNLMYNI